MKNNIYIERERHCAGPVCQKKDLYSSPKIQVSICSSSSGCKVSP